MIGEVVDQAAWRRVRKRLGLDEVLPAQVDAVTARLARGLIDEPLQHIRRLRPTGTAIGIDAAGVRERHLHVAVDVRRAVDAGEQRRVVEGRDRAGAARKVGADVGEGMHAQRQEVALGVECQLGMRAMVAAVRIGEEGLGAVGGPADRSAELPAHPAQRRFLRIDEDLAAEAAPDVRRDHAQVCLGDSQHRIAQRRAHGVRVLARRVERVLAGRALIARDRGARLHGARHEPVVPQVERRDMGGRSERMIRRGRVAELPITADVVRHIVPDKRRTGLDGGSAVGDRFEHVVVDFDCGQRIERRESRRGDDDGDRFTDVAHLVDCQGVVRWLGHRLAIAITDLPAARDAADAGALQIGAAVGGDHTGQLQGGAEVDAADGGMRVRRTDESRMQLARKAQVVDVAPRSEQETRVLLATHRLADAAGRDRVVGRRGRGIRQSAAPLRPGAA